MDISRTYLFVVPSRVASLETILTGSITGSDMDSTGIDECHVSDDKKRFSCKLHGYNHFLESIMVCLYQREKFLTKYLQNALQNVYDSFSTCKMTDGPTNE